MISFVNGIVKLPDFPKCVLLTGKRTEGKLLVFAQEPEHIIGKLQGILKNGVLGI